MNPSPERQAAEVVKSNLRSPSSFKFIDGEVLWKGNTLSGENAYVVAVAYDAQNGFGAMLRGCALVAYYVAKSGQLSWNNMFGFQEMEGALTGMCNKNMPEFVKNNYVLKLAEINKFTQSTAVSSTAYKNTELKNDNILQTVRGEISISNNILFLNNEQLEPKIEGDFSLSVERNIKFKNGNAILLFNNSGGSACPGRYRWLLVEKKYIIQTKQFGNCSDLIDVDASSNKITIKFQPFRPGDNLTVEFDGEKVMEIQR